MGNLDADLVTGCNVGNCLQEVVLLIDILSERTMSMDVCTLKSQKIMHLDYIL